MADLIVFPEAVDRLAKGTLDLDGDTLKGVLVSTLSTVPNEPNALTVGGFTTLDEYDGSSYARTALTGVAVSKNSAAQRIQLAASSVAFGTLGASSRAAVGLLIVKHVDGAGGDIPISFQRFVANVNGDGSTAYSVTFPSGHILHCSYPA